MERATVKALISIPLNGDEEFVSMIMTGIEIDKNDYKNERVVANALRQLANEIEKTGFLLKQKVVPRD